MKISEGMAIIEAILFAHGDPISLDKLVMASQIDRESVVKLVDQLDRKYNVSESGFCILKIDDGFQLATRAPYAPYVKAALETRRQTPLSQAAMETLAIIAYNQPVTKAFVEQVRGIDSNYVVNSLVERGLIEDAGRLDLPGRPISYRTTDTFLRVFSLQSLKQLPPLPGQEGQMSFDTVLEEMEEISVDDDTIIDEEVPELSDEETELLSVFDKDL